jgi:hypothetical protein
MRYKTGEIYSMRESEEVTAEYADYRLMLTFNWEPSNCEITYSVHYTENGYTYHWNIPLGKYASIPLNSI